MANLQEADIYNLTEPMVRRYLLEDLGLEHQGYEYHAKEIAEGVARTLVSNLEEPEDSSSPDLGFDR